MNFLSHFPESSRGILVVPSLILYSMPPWFTGISSSWHIHRWSGTSSNYGNVTGKSAHKKYNKRDQAKHVCKF
jgi:hypothetical protein